MTTTNSLAQASSAYLRSAMHQPIRWHQWGEEAFAAAQRENKPILLDIGAVWCHWCHVMDRESYDDPEVARIVNENFIAVKVDRDERPDIDSRYQSAVQAMTGQGGWPLTAFLTPEGKPFYGGTYFPPDDQLGTSRLQARAHGHCRRLPRQARRGAAAGRHGAERHQPRRVVRRTQRQRSAHPGARGGRLGAQDLRSRQRRLRQRAQVSASRRRWT